MEAGGIEKPQGFAVQLDLSVYSGMYEVSHSVITSGLSSYAL